MRTGHSAHHFPPVAPCLVYHIIPLLTTIQTHSLLVRTTILTGLSVPVVASAVHRINFSLTASITILSHFLLAAELPPLIYHAYIYDPFPASLTSQ